MPKLSYYGDPISENIADTPEGYRICRNAVLARTGFQTYKASELSDTIRTKLIEFGITLNDDDEIEFYRSPEAVFNPTFIASLEGKPLTDEHPEELLDAETHKEHSVGHAQHVRQRDQPLDSGDLGLCGDIFITDADAVEKHKAGRRELSCGYTYDIRQNGSRIEMIDLIGNHVALVPKGRAGKEVGIMDAAPKEVQREPFDMSKLLDSIRKKGWLAWAKDAKPEEVADAMGDMEKVAAETSTAPADGKGSEGKGADADKHVDGCKCSDCMPTGKDAMELKAARDAKGGKGKDDETGELTEAEAAAAIAELEKELAEDADKDDVEEEEEMEDADEDEDKDKGKGEGEDADIVATVEPLDGAERPKEIVATDAAKVLKALRPFVAKSKDKALRAAFDSAAKLVNKRSAKVVGKDAGYGGFTRASQRSGESAMDSRSKPGDEIAQASKLEETYAKFRGKPLGTVKADTK